MRFLLASDPRRLGMPDNAADASPDNKLLGCALNGTHEGDDHRSTCLTRAEYRFCLHSGNLHSTLRPTLKVWRVV